MALQFWGAKDQIRAFMGTSQASGERNCRRWASPDAYAQYDPARPYRARDKAKIEVAVQVVTRSIIAKLRNRQFFAST